jgi:hypothetical protein
VRNYKYAPYKVGLQCRSFTKRNLRLSCINSFIRGSLLSIRPSATKHGPNTHYPTYISLSISNFVIVGYLKTGYPKKPEGLPKTVHELGSPSAKQLGGKIQKATRDGPPSRPVHRTNIRRAIQRGGTAEQHNEAGLASNLPAEQPNETRLSSNRPTEQPSKKTASSQEEPT